MCYSKFAKTRDIYIYIKGERVSESSLSTLAPPIILNQEVSNQGGDEMKRGEVWNRAQD